ncbi:conjugal transfer protein TrbF [Sphingobium phenoxybenzoativorans]|uniref:Conjugal transfer protein TrbF n=1 Tax=Sphingobium phenoxybenzoativorans TaxID=1592790 RepID=A0A975K9Q6_9SPHN|nr:conjugal transfer protein TrbF [Sphingobium phenoxybenzoativorans]QUT06949.1 conjugal transfer protein TrbF [Sphingobium phenoxybenzoativorans]
MILKRAVQRYGHTPEPETPYQRAGQIWDERIGSARIQAHNWRLMAFGTLGLTTLLSAALVWQSLQSRVTPYVVEVDNLGEARAVSEADANYQPTDPQIAWQLGKFIENVRRSTSLDPVLMRRAWLSAYDFSTERGARTLGDYARQAKPFARIGERTVMVQVISVVRASDRSFQVKWIETIFERGTAAGTSRWTAILTIVTTPPTSADMLRRNPLGIYVDAIDWSRELEPQATPALSEAREAPEPIEGPAADSQNLSNISAEPK